MTDTELRELVAAAQARYDALDPYQKLEHDWEQRRSFVRGMCADNQDYAEWCNVVDRLMPPLPKRS